MASFKKAKALGAPGIELDIHRCSSGELIVFHDDTTKRLCPGTDFSIIDTPWETLRTLDIGSWKSPDFSSERPILLSELLEELGSSLYFDIEIKARTTEDRGAEAALAELLKKMNIPVDTAVFSSFNPVALRRFKKLAPAYSTAVIYCKSKELPWYLRKGQGRFIAGCDFLKPEHVNVSKASVLADSSIGGYPVIPWTVDDGALAQDLLRKGCIGIITNKPDVILQAIRT
jgi:glycerophosphoryl diester phosphodiesterase